MTPKMTTTTRMVLLCFLQDPDGEMYGRQIMQQTGLLPGTVYPILTRLWDAGWLVSRQEDPDAFSTGRPPRRYYRLTSDGWETARRQAWMTTGKETAT